MAGTLLVILGWIPARSCRSYPKENSSTHLPPQHSGPRCDAEVTPAVCQGKSARSIPGFTPAASCHRQTCPAVHKQMSFGN